MLLNAQGKDVTKIVDNIARNNPKVYNKNRINILAHLREVLIPDNHHQGDMFKIGTRAVLK